MKWAVIAAVFIVAIIFGARTTHRATPETIGAAFAPLTFDAPVSSTTSASEVAALSGPSETKKYVNSKYHFVLWYPQDLSLHEYDEGSGATTVVFQNEQEAKGFQIFIVPYTEKTISRAQFLKDSPAGILRDPKNTSVGGVTATSFYGKNALLGETYEIWLIRNGYLFEVSTPIDQKPQIDGLVRWWTFD